VKPPALIEAVEGLKQEFLKQHRKDAHRATQVWQSLVDKARSLAKDIGYGDAIPRDRWPQKFRNHPNLSRLELPHAHRALYSAYYDAERDLHKVVIEWIGSHKAYDELFGYSS